MSLPAASTISPAIFAFSSWPSRLNRFADGFHATLSRQLDGER